MAFVLPHAPPKGIPNLKVPAAVSPPKTAHHAVHGPQTPHAETPKTKFQSLLEHLVNAKGDEKTKAPKAKLETAVAEKPKEAKKPDHKELPTSLPGAEVLAVQLKAEPPKPKVEADASAAAPVKAAFPRGKGDAPVPQAVTQASMEVARSQAQQTFRAEKQEDRPRVFVVDRRTDVKEKEKLKLPGAEAAAQQPVTGAEAQAQQNKVADPKTAPVEVQVVFQTGGKAKEPFDMKPQNATVSPRDAAAFQQYLVDKGYGQLVDQARIVLKDQNAGEIRMTLYPESLGKVKVALDLSDNSLVGQIFVENQTVKDVFQQNMDGLVKAFQEGGWDAMSLEVSVGDGRSDQPQNRQAASTAPARDYGRQVTQNSDTGAIATWNGQSQINLTA